MKQFLKDVFYPFPLTSIEKNKLTVLFIGMFFLSLFLLSSCGTQYQGRCDGIYHPAVQDRR